VPAAAFAIAIVWNDHGATTMTNYRVGLLGFGFIGKVHAYAYDVLRWFYNPPPAAGRIVRVLAGRPESTRAAAEMLGAEPAADFREITEAADIDIVHICTPNALHAEALLSALAHHKHIYCDKPLTADWTQATAVAAALPAWRGIGQMTLHYRFYPAVMRMKQLADAGALGEVLEFRAFYLHGGSADPNAPWRWKFSAAAGGGVLADLAVHAIDLVEHLIGPLDAVMAEQRTVFLSRPVAAGSREMRAVDAEDQVMMLARSARGARGVITAGKVATGCEDELRVELHGTAGALRYNSMDPHHCEYFDAQHGRTVPLESAGWTRLAAGRRFPPPATGFPSPKAPIGWLEGHVAALANFLQAVEAGEPAEPGLHRGVELEQRIEAVRRSAQRQAWVRIAEVKAQQSAAERLPRGRR